MDIRSLVIHILVCIGIAGILAYFTELKWLAGAFLVSAVLFINGSIAYVEDGKPGGFDNPDGNETPEYAEGTGATLFAVKSFCVFVILLSIGLYIQFS
jgi:hypothetical protein